MDQTTFWLTATSGAAGHILSSNEEGDDQSKTEDLVSVFNQPTVLNFPTIFAGAAASIANSETNLPGQTVPSLNQIGITPSKRATLIPIPINNLQSVSCVNHITPPAESQITPTTTIVVNALNGASASTLATTVYTLPLLSDSAQIPKNFIQHSAAETSLTATDNLGNVRNHILFSSNPADSSTAYELDASHANQEAESSSIADATANAIIQQSQTLSFLCNECGKSFDNSGQLSYHTFVAHGELQARPHKCTACPESFLAEHHLADHMRALHLPTDQGGGPPFTCTECIKDFDDGGHLNFHLYMEHTAQGAKSKQSQQYPCPECGKVFMKSTLRTAHIRNVHDGQVSALPPTNLTLGTAPPTAIQQKSHKCLECGKAFKTQSYLKQHVMSVHNKPLKCSLCGRGFGRKSDLKRHMRGVHMKKRPHICNKCGWTFSEIGNLKHHIQAVHRKQKNYRCMYCDKTFTLSSYLRTHLIRMHSIDVDSLKTSMPVKENETLEAETIQLATTTEQETSVAQQTPTVINLAATPTRTNTITLETLQISIAQAQVARCYECGQTFDNTQLLQEHVMSSHSQPFWCTLCGEGFSLASHLQIHLQLRHSDLDQPTLQPPTIQTLQAIDLQRSSNGQFSLEFREAMPTASTVTAQMPIITKQSEIDHSQSATALEVAVEVAPPHQEEVTQPLTTKCNMCGAVCDPNGEKHICWKKMAGLSSIGVSDLTVERERPHVCNDCGKGFKTMTHLKQHIRCVHSKEKPHKCNQCEKCFARTSDLNRHIKGVHQKLKVARSEVFVTLKCSECGAMFAEPTQLKRHIYTMHLQGKPTFKCADCQEGFANEAEFQNHICHEVEKPHVCTICSKRFQMVQQLRRHTRAAHGRQTEEPQIHKCFQCERVFGRPVDLERHIQAVHLKEKPHKCGLCGKGFGLQGNLNKHVRAVHLLEKPHQCVECGKRFAHVGVLKRHLRDIHFYDKKTSVKQRLAAIQMKKARALVRNMANIETITAEPDHSKTGIIPQASSLLQDVVATQPQENRTPIGTTTGNDIVVVSQSNARYEIELPRHLQHECHSNQQSENVVQPQGVSA